MSGVDVLGVFGELWDAAAHRNYPAGITERALAAREALIQLLDRTTAMTKAVRAFSDNPEMSKNLRDALYIKNKANDCDVKPYVDMCEANDALEAVLSLAKGGAA